MLSSPRVTHRHANWMGWTHWVHNATHKVQRHLPSSEALAAAKALGLNGQAEWHAWPGSNARPTITPSAPGKVCAQDGTWPATWATPSQETTLGY